MTKVLRPSETSPDGLEESAVDPTAPHGMVFYHAKEGKPLATPWQVALARARMVNAGDIPQGVILDCACGSGIQLAAYAAVLSRPALGVELDPQRAQASAVNIHNIARERGEADSPNMASTRVVNGDGTDGQSAMDLISEDLGKPIQIGLLHLDPARPRNSREHGLDEMAPRLGDVFDGWKPHLNSGARGPALILDLSPRLSHEQRLQVEALVDERWPGIERTWSWTSRGRGRVDRLALWLGSASLQGVARRFVRIPPQISNDPLVITGGSPITQGDGLPIEKRRPPRKGERVTILDAALVESGLADDWLAKATKNSEIHWGVVQGRRPQIYHDKRLNLEESERILVQCTGRIVALVHSDLTLESVDGVAEVAVENNIGKLTVRVPLDSQIQPKIQGALDRQILRRSGQRRAFLAKQPGDEMLLLCIEE